jgi:hypothetical protein
LLGPLLLAAAGCGGGKATVSGVVTHQGKPLVHGTVVVVGSDGLRMTGIIMPDGHYRVEDVASGAVKLGVISREPGRGASRPGMKGGRSEKEPEGGAAPAPAPPVPERGKWFPIPDKYEDPEKSGLATKLRTGDNAYDIELP